MRRLKDAWSYLTGLANILVKYKYVLLVAAVGMVLILWPFGEGEKDRQTADAAAQAEPADPSEMEARLTALLSRAEGVGRVEVMLSLASDMEYVYADEYTRAYDESRTGEGASSSAMEESVRYMTVRQEDGGETPVIRRRIYPAYKGAVVVCDGADNAGTRLKVIHAVAALTGLSSERITVIKMK